MDIRISARIIRDLGQMYINADYANKTFFKTRMDDGVLMPGVIAAICRHSTGRALEHLFQTGNKVSSHSPYWRR